MTTARSCWLPWVVGFWLTAVLLAGWARDRATPSYARAPDGAATEPSIKIELAPAHSPLDQALREARTEWIHAQQAAARQLELSPDAGPDGVVWHLTDTHRQFLMRVDQSGALGRARHAARRAAVLARTLSERWHAAELLARLACEAGHHRAELRYARQLIALQPQQQPSWETLKHAALCNGDFRLVQHADERLKGLSRGRARPDPYNRRSESPRVRRNGKSGAYG